MSPDLQPKGPEDFAWFTYLWIVCLSSLGGFVAFLRKVKEGNARAWNFAEFFGEITTSAFTGILTFFLCQNANLAPLLTAAFVGISGHMGSRALFQLERYFTNRFPAPEEKAKVNDDHKS